MRVSGAGRSVGEMGATDLAANLTTMSQRQASTRPRHDQPAWSLRESWRGRKEGYNWRGEGGGGGGGGGGRRGGNGRGHGGSADALSAAARAAATILALR